MMLLYEAEEEKMGMRGMGMDVDMGTRKRIAIRIIGCIKGGGLVLRSWCC